MASLNQCNFIGRCGKSPETRYTASGVCCVNVSIACDETFKNKLGEKETKTEWINLAFFGKLAEIVSQYVSQGSLIYVSGRMQTEKYTKDGVDKTSTKIVCEKIQMLSGKGEGSGKAPSQQHQGSQYEEPVFNPDDEIPF